MFSTFFIKIYFLFFFLFIFLFAFQNYWKIDSFQILIALYSILLIPLKILFTNHFERLIWDFKYKNILYLWKFVVSSLFVLIWYLFAGNSLELLFIISYIFLLFYKIDSYHLFSLALVYFGWFFINYFLGSDVKIYSNYIIFWLYSLIFWIIYTWISNYIVYKKIIWNSLMLVSLIFLILSFYIHNFIPYLPIIWIIILSILNISKEAFRYVSNIKTDIIIVSLAIIIFIPFINDFLKFEEKNILLLSSIISFFISYIWYNLILKKALS